MNGLVSPLTIVFLILAVIIFWRLRSVLGRRTGSERPPFNPYARRDQTPRSDKVIALPPRAGRPAPEPLAATLAPPPADADQRLRDVAVPGTPLAEALRTLIATDPGFEPRRFVDGAKGAYEMVVTAFAEGDRKQLRQLLAREVYDGFIAAITERETRQEKIAFRFVGIDKAEITDAVVRGRTAQVTVRFNSQLISATKDKDGKVIDGDEVKVSEVTDIWTFAREIGNRDPNWKLAATESVE